MSADNQMLSRGAALDRLMPLLLPLTRGEGTKPSENVEVAIADARSWIAQARTESSMEPERDFGGLLAAADALEVAALALDEAQSRFDDDSGEVGFARRNQLRTDSRLVVRVCIQQVARHFGDTVGDTRRRLVVGHATGLPHLVNDLEVLADELTRVADDADSRTAERLREAAVRAVSTRELLLASMRPPEHPIERRDARRLRNAAWMHFSTARHNFKHELFLLFAFEPARRRSYRSTPRRPSARRSSEVEA